MARLSRVFQKIFASSASNNGVFGAAQDGTKTLSSDLATLMGKPAFLTGWLSAVIGGSKFPPLEEFQALNYINTSQLAYIFQEGIPEYDASTTYYNTSLVKKAGTFQLYKSLTNGNVGNALTSTGNWQLVYDFGVPARIRLTANTTFYVATTGNDSTGDGSAGAPWQTINKAISYLQTMVDLNGFVATIQLAAGTYTSGLSASGPFVGQVEGVAYVRLLGDTSNPANVLISTTSADAVSVSYGALLHIAGVKLQTTTSGNLLAAIYGGIIVQDGNMYFGVSAGNGAYSMSGASILFTANYSIVGNIVGDHWYGDRCATVNVNSGLTVTLSGTPSFVNFAAVGNAGVIICGGVTFTGSGTGTRYVSQQCSVINTTGAGATYLPGNVAGSTATNGVYV